MRCRNSLASLSFASFYFLLFLGRGCRAASVVRTVDDTDPSVSFSDKSWNDQTCSFCTAKPENASLAFNGTWHEDTRLNGTANWASIQFTGTAISAYAILPGNATGGPAIKDLNVTIIFDGRSAGSLQRGPTTQNYQFNVQIFSVAGQDNVAHNLTLVLGVNSLLMIDYFNITSEESVSTSTALSANSTSPASLPEPSPVPHHGLTTGAIVGIVIGAIACVALVITATIFLRNVRREQTLLESAPSSGRSGAMMIVYPNHGASNNTNNSRHTRNTAGSSNRPSARRGPERAAVG